MAVGKCYPPYEIAPLYSTGIFLLMTILYTVVEGEVSLLTKGYTWAFLLAVTSVVLGTTYFISFAVVMPIYKIIQSNMPIFTLAVMVGATIAGALLLPFGWHLMIGPTKIDQYLYFCGSISGAVYGISFWLIENTKGNHGREN